MTLRAIALVRCDTVETLACITARQQVKCRDMSYRVVNLMACEEDGQLSIFDKSGVCITSFQSDRLGVCERSDAMWATWSQDQLASNNKEKLRQIRQRDDWLRWAGAVISGNKRGRWRFPKLTHPRFKPVTDWTTRIYHMLHMARHLKTRQERNHGWYKWSESVAHNSLVRSIAAKHHREAKREGDSCDD